MGSLAVIADVVNNKSAECNFVQLVSTKQGTSFAFTRDCLDFFASWQKKMVGIKNVHRFKILPSRVFVKEHSNPAEVALDILKGPWTPDADELPTFILPAGLTPDQQWYLYNSIAQTITRIQLAHYL